MLKLRKIRFTSWRDQSVTPRSLEFQQQLDALTARGRVLSDTAAWIKKERANGNLEADQKTLTRIAADQDQLDVARATLVAAEKAAVAAEQRAAHTHRNVGTFGYEVVNSNGHVAMIVDEAGDYLPIEAVYTHDLVDDNPPLPEWAKTGKVGRFE